LASGLGACWKKARRIPPCLYSANSGSEGGIDVINVITGIKRKSSIDGKKSIIERIPASQWKKVARLEPAMIIFSSDLRNSLSAPFTLICMIDLSCQNVGNYSYQLKDTINMQIVCGQLRFMVVLPMLNSLLVVELSKPTKF
jgi:hypothetical protein